MKDMLERLKGIDPSDDMSVTMSIIDEIIGSIRKDPGSALSTEALALIYEKEERTRDYYMRPFDSDGLYNMLIQVHKSRGEDDKVEHYKRCLDLRQARKWTILGDSYSLMGLNYTAAKYLKRALFFGPTEDLVLEVKKGLQRSEEKVERAASEVAALNSKYENDPKNLKLVLKLTGLLIDLDRLDDAETVVKKAARDHPEDPDLLFRKGCILFGRSKYPEARKIFSKLLEGNPKSVTIKRANNLSEEMVTYAK